MPARIPGRFFARNLVERRSLLFQLVKRDFQQRYVGSTAGWVWGLIHPLVLLASYYFIFVVCLHWSPPAGALSQNYAMFIFAGMLPWLLFLETVSRSAGSIVEQANLITRTIFPAEIVPVSIFLSALVSHLLAISMVVIAGALWLQHVSVMIVLLPVTILLLGMFAIGFSWIVSALQVYLRDTAQMVTVIMTFWFWATPIFVQETEWQRFPRAAQIALKLNPLVYAVRVYRELLLGHSGPPLHDLVPAAIAGIAAFVAGGLFFRHMKRGFADVL